MVTYAKQGPEDLCITVSATNHGPQAAPLHLLPQIWLRNTWAWGRDRRRSTLHQLLPPTLSVGGLEAVECKHGLLGYYYLAAEGTPEVLFCDNETNAVELFGAAKNTSKYTKDGINNRVVKGDTKAVNPANSGTKAAFWYDLGLVEPGRDRRGAAPALAHRAGQRHLRPRLRRACSTSANGRPTSSTPRSSTRPCRRPTGTSPAAPTPVCSGASSSTGTTSTNGSTATRPNRRPRIPARAVSARNRHWGQLALADVISMPDEWEYPWFAAWDLAFHAIPLAHVDPDFAKEQLVLMCREWSMHPNGQLPAYEWEFGDVNPPVHAWAAWHVYRIDGYRDRDFLIRVFTKLLLNFSWWINRKDADGSNIFEGGFLGMDNIGLFNRSAKLPPGYRLEQSDATSWMAFYCQQMFKIALELSRHDQAWDEMATKFLEHFLSIAKAMNSFGSHDMSLWHEDDGFFYDVLVNPDGKAQHMRVRSMVGLLPILGATEVPAWIATDVPDVTSRLRWLQRRRPELVGPVAVPFRTWRPADAAVAAGPGTAAPDPGAAVRLGGVPVARSASARCRRPRRETVTAEVGGQHVSIEYEPGESRTGMFGGNSNWRGPIWFPVNVLLADKLRTYGRHFGDSFQIEIPTGSGNLRNLEQAADTIDNGLTALFRPVDGKRPADGERIEAVRQPAVERASDVQRVLRRRHRRGPRGDPPDRLDRPRRAPAQPAAAPGSAEEAHWVEMGFGRPVARRRVAFSARNPHEGDVLRDCCPRHRPDRISRTRSGPRPGRSLPACARRMAGHRRDPRRPIDGRGVLPAAGRRRGRRPGHRGGGCRTGGGRCGAGQPGTADRRSVPQLHGHRDGGPASA